jgi:hypothetical protein
MNPSDYIKQRQILWAFRHGKRLGGQYRNSCDPEQVDRGQKSFVFDLNDNLFEELSPETRMDFEAGDGGELQGKMLAVNSSSAIAVNFFDYWRKRQLVAEIAKVILVPSSGITGLRFEAKYPIHDQFVRPPNLDVVIEYNNTSPRKVTAIECKFGEPYGRRGSHGLKPVYLDHDEFWTDLPNLREIAVQVSPENTRFTTLDAPQLIKHVLGLKKAYGKGGFRLLYLWYDVPGPEAVRHSEEIAEFSRIMSRDGLTFQSITYQDVILSLAKHQRVGHEVFVDYLVERYL